MTPLIAAARMVRDGLIEHGQVGRLDDGNGNRCTVGWIYTATPEFDLRFELFNLWQDAALELFGYANLPRINDERPWLDVIELADTAVEMAEGAGW